MKQFFKMMFASTLGVMLAMGIILTVLISMTIGSVSYTHLDVYKRQDLTSPNIHNLPLPSSYSILIAPIWAFYEVITEIFRKFVEIRQPIIFIKICEKNSPILLGSSYPYYPFFSGAFRQKGRICLLYTSIPTRSIRPG